MDPGKLRHRVTIQQPAHPTADGETTTTWADVAETWAAIEPIAGREYFTATEFRADVTHRVTIRHRAGMKSTWRLLLGHGATQRVFYPMGPPIDVGERNKWLEMMCREAESG